MEIEDQFKEVIILAEFVIGPAIALGLIIGVYEALVIHRDVKVPTHRFGHMVHALILSTAFVFASMNTEWVLTMIPALQAIPLLGTVLGARIALGLIAAIKIHGVSQAVKGAGGGPGLGETWFHSIIVGALITAAPYAYPVIEPALPSWLKF
ncbi:hypothetical protein C4580_01440 [Candidatus Woesearchaeota archaeon]|nr:MAG: hypothetical protein C4580_01440 [Candidatus Woesearchaeota archaeon]